ncbi:MAG TPA: hypothetical protein VML55_01645 [Planctomycetaceae bacterium]|nr:hypothetical protein [Planctomycetaceae bacterium]
MRWLRLLGVMAVTYVLVASTAGFSPADEPGDEAVFSGPQPGEKLPAFKVRGVYAAAAGKDVDFVAQAGGGPLVLVFVHERTRPAFGIVRALMNYDRQRRLDESLRGTDDLTLGVIWLTADATETEKWLGVVKQYLGEDAPVGISLDGAEGPGSYGLNRNVALTILVADEGRVAANFALVQPSLQADVPKVLDAIVKVAGGRMPDLRRLDGEKRPAPRPMAELPDELAGMLRRLIRKDAGDEQVARAAREIEAYFEKHKDAGPQVGRIARRIIDAGRLENYGTPKAREQLKTWAEKYAPAIPEPAEREKRESGSTEKRQVD